MLLYDLQMSGHVLPRKATLLQSGEQRIVQLVNKSPE
jgi:hypothetical protein